MYVPVKVSPNTAGLELGGLIAVQNSLSVILLHAVITCSAKVCLQEDQQCLNWVVLKKLLPNSRVNILDMHRAKISCGITISNKFYGLMKDQPTSTTTIVVLATMLKMTLFTYLEYSRVDG